MAGALLTVVASPLTGQVATLGDDLGAEIGVIASIGVHPSQHTVVVADEGLRQLVAFGRDGTFLGRVGRAGFGPGEFMAPRGLIVDEGGLVHVLDPGTGQLSRFRLVDGSPPEFQESVRLDLAGMSDACLIDGELWVLGSGSEHILHHIVPDGRIARSIASPYGEDPIVASATTGGLLSCTSRVGEEPVLLVASELHGSVRAFSRRGRLLWRTTPPDFLPVHVEVVDGGVLFKLGPDEFYHKVVSLGLVNDTEIWVQYGRLDAEVKRVEEVVEVQTVILSIEDGRVLATPDWPRIDAIQGMYAYGVDNHLTPVVHVYSRQVLDWGLR